jgi:hypothetical protein
MRLGKILLAGIIALMAVQIGSAQTVFKHVMARYVWSYKDRYMYTVWVELNLDTPSKKLTVKSKERPLDLKFEDVKEIVLDQKFHNIYVGYRKADGKAEPYMFWIEPDIWEQVVAKFKDAFGDRVSEFSSLVGTRIEKSSLKSTGVSFNFKVDKKHRPMGEIKPDKALVVLVCLPFHYRATAQGKVLNLHVNGDVVAAFRMGTYVYFYLDPGEYVLASEADNPSELKMKVEAGKDYYLMQDTKVGFRKYTAELSTHPKQVVLYELEGTYYADYKKKK